MKELDKIESRFETIFNHVTEGILIAGADGNIILANPIINRLFGYEENELLGQKIEVLIPKELAEKHKGHRSGYMQNPKQRPMGRSAFLEGVSKDGRRFPVEISLSYYKTGEDTYVIAFVIDITDRYVQQERIKGINEELKALNESLEKKVNDRTLVLREALHELEQSRDELSKALEAEKELNELKTRFISMASHEFRTPLSTILSSVSLIGKYTSMEDQDKREKHVSRIKNAVQGLTDILNDFLSIGKLEEGKVTANMKSGDVIEIIEGVIAEMTPVCKAGQTIRFSDGEACETMVDKMMLRNVMFNLLSNAIKFSPENSVNDVMGV